MTTSRTARFLLASILIFIVFRGIAVVLESADWTLVMLLICAVVVASSAMAWSLIQRVPILSSVRAIGFGVPDWRAVGLAAVLALLLVAFIPAYAAATGSAIGLHDNWPWILLGIVTGVGIAEETLFRGFVFNFLRQDRSFLRAASLSMVLFGAMHLLLLLWLPLVVAIAAIVLAIIAAYPTAYLFEKGNNTIWPSAILHSAALGTNLFSIPSEIETSFNLLWIGVVVIVLLLVFAAGRSLLGTSRTG